MRKLWRTLVSAALIAALSAGVMACGGSADEAETTTVGAVSEASESETTLAAESEEDTTAAEDTSSQMKAATVRYRNPYGQTDYFESDVVITGAEDYYALEYWEVCEFEYDEEEDSYLSTRYDKYLIFASETQASAFCSAEGGEQDGCVVLIDETAGTQYYVAEEESVEYEKYLRGIVEGDYIVLYDEAVEPSSMADEIISECAETITTVSESDTFIVFAYDATTGACCSIDEYRPCDSDDETALAQITLEVEDDEAFFGDYFQYEFLDGGWLHIHYDVDFTAELEYSDGWELLMYMYGYCTTRNATLASSEEYGGNVYDGEYLPFLE